MWLSLWFSIPVHLPWDGALQLALQMVLEHSILNKVITTQTFQLNEELKTPL